MLGLKLIHVSKRATDLRVHLITQGTYTVLLEPRENATTWWNWSHCSIMMTSWNGNIFRFTGHLCREFTGPRWIPRTKASDSEPWCFFYLRLNKRSSKQSRGWWFETPSRPLWRHRNDSRVSCYDTGRSLSQCKDGLSQVWDSIIKMRRSSDRLIFIIGIFILVRRCLYIETVPWDPFTDLINFNPNMDK